MLWWQGGERWRGHSRQTCHRRADLGRVGCGCPLADDERDWRLATRSELIDHLLARYHEVHRVQLPELIRLAKRVEHVHGERQDCPKGLSVHLSLMLDELELHMQKEEADPLPPAA